jgi:GT2 family glycosyltransferase
LSAAAPHGEPAAPEVTVVVPTYRRPGLLRPLLDALAAQDFGGAFEVVLVDDCSPPGDARAVDREAARTIGGRPVRVIHQDRNRGPAAARNAGWRSARAPLVAFTDDDCRPAPDWLSRITGAFAAGADVVQGAVEPVPSDLPSVRAFSRVLRHAADDGWFPSANVAYRRTLLEALGGFDERFPGAAGEDTDLAWRARGSHARVGTDGDAVMFHVVHHGSFLDYLREKRRWASIPLVVGRHPELRRHCHSRWFWRESHPVALAGAAGALAALGAVRTRSRPLRLALSIIGVTGMARYGAFRMWEWLLPVRGWKRLALVPAALVADVYEVAVMVRGSWRHRTLLL